MYSLALTMTTDFSNSDHEGRSTNEVQLSRPAGRPLCTVPVTVDRVCKGDQILCLINDNEEYRPMYRSALVEKTSNENISIIVYTPDGVERCDLELNLLKPLLKVVYTDDAFAEDVAIRNARQRLVENHYHALNNNSHHFVTNAKTGLEYSLADLIHAIQVI